MKINHFCSITLICITTLIVMSCKDGDEDKQHYDNKAFISASNFVEELLIQKDAAEISRNITVSLAKPEGKEVKVSFATAPALLETYRLAYYDPEAIILPEDNYKIEEPVAAIAPGSVTSNPVTVKFININSLDDDMRYVLPVTVSSIEGIGLLASAKTVYYIFKGASLINVAAGLANNRAWPEWTNGKPVKDMSTFTLEALVYGNQFKNQISTIIGIEGIFLVRVGDAGLASNQIQIATDKTTNLTSGDLKLQSKQWYHIAVTFDKGAVSVYINGVQKLTGTAGSTSVDFSVEHSDEAEDKPRCFWIGYSYDNNRYLDGMISEVRIWNKALTEEEINSTDHFYTVEPDSEGLVAYWKFNEGAGTIIKDYTVHGNDLTAEKELKWTQVALPEKKK